MPLEDAPRNFLVFSLAIPGTVLMSLFFLGQLLSPTDGNSRMVRKLEMMLTLNVLYHSTPHKL